MLRIHMLIPYVPEGPQRDSLKSGCALLADVELRRNMPSPTLPLEDQFVEGARLVRGVIRSAAQDTKGPQRARWPILRAAAEQDFRRIDGHAHRDTLHGAVGIEVAALAVCDERHQHLARVVTQFFGDFGVGVVSVLQAPPRGFHHSRALRAQLGAVLDATVSKRLPALAATGGKVDVACMTSMAQGFIDSLENPQELAYHTATLPGLVEDHLRERLSSLFRPEVAHASVRDNTAHGLYQRLRRCAPVVNPPRLSPTVAVRAFAAPVAAPSADALAAPMPPRAEPTTLAPAAAEIQPSPRPPKPGLNRPPRYPLTAENLRRAALIG